MIDGRARASAAGFSLLETLLALTLLSVMLLILYTGLRTTLNAEDAVEERVEAAERVRNAQSLLRRQLSIALAYPVDGWTPGTRPPFLGDERSVTFVGSRPGPIDDGRHHLQSFAFVEHNGGVALVYLPSSGNAPSDPGREGDAGDPLVLLDGLESGRFEYLAGPGLIAQATWVEEWRMRANLPLLVRVRATPKANTALRWPLLNVRLRHYDPNP